MLRKLLLAVLAGWFVIAGSLVPRLAGVDGAARAQDATNPMDKLSLESLSAPPPGGYRPTPHRAFAAHRAMRHASVHQTRARYRPRPAYRGPVYRRPVYRRPVYRHTTYRRATYRPRYAAPFTHHARTPYRR